MWLMSNLYQLSSGMLRSILVALAVILFNPVVRAEPQAELPTASHAGSGSAITIVSSIRPLTFIAQAIAGDEADLATIIGPNDSAHHFSLSPGDRLQLEAADILLWVGPVFEVELGEFFQRRRHGAELITVLDIANTTVHTLEDGSIDPHVWLDPDNARLIAAALAEQLGIINPSQREVYQQRLREFSATLESSTAQIRERLAGLSRDGFVVYHNAYQYYEKQFGLSHALALVANPDVAPGIRETLTVQNRIAELQPLCVLLEPDYNPALLRTLLGGTTTREVTIDLLGYESSRESASYTGLLDTVTDGFTQCLTSGANEEE